MSPFSHWTRLKAVFLGLGLGLAVTATIPTVSHAIPVAGEYVFTSGLTGSFTSDGSSLTVWHIQITPIIAFTSANIASTNNGSTFDQTEISPLGQFISLSLSWDQGQLPSGFFSAILDQHNPAGPFSASMAPVPEPSSFALVGLGLGLLALVDYGRRQRRQAGLQIG